jgi:hypothetical protein
MKMWQYSSVSIVTCRKEGIRFPGGADILNFGAAFLWDTCQTQPPTHCLCAIFFQGVKQPECEADHLHTFRSE